MFEFSGELSNESKKYLLKGLTRFSVFAALFATTVISIPIIVLGLLWETWVLFFLIITVMLFILMACPKTNPQEKTVINNILTKITIQNEMIEGYCNETSMYIRRELTAVKKVVDIGEGYHILFYSPHSSGFFLCQKNLIVKGTIEEFEKFFEGKIRKKAARVKTLRAGRPARYSIDSSVCPAGCKKKSNVTTMEIFKIDALLSYGRLLTMKKLTILYIGLAIALLFPSITIPIFITIFTGGVTWNSDIVFALVGCNLFSISLSSVLIWLSTVNNKLKKKALLWLKDATEVKAHVKRLDIISPEFKPYQVQVDFEIDKKPYNKISASGNVITGYRKVFAKYANREIRILYSKKYDQVLILKQ